jgi:hypothetical protein
METLDKVYKFIVRTWEITLKERVEEMFFFKMNSICRIGQKKIIKPAL